MRLSDVTRGSLTKEQVEEYTDALTRHYGERVAPVSEYCNAFRAWVKALGERKQRIEAMEDGPAKEYELASPLTKIPDMAWAIELAILKSNLLSRLIYGGQPLRTEMCPVHQGRWSGCEWNSFCECMDGYDVTGWLPNHKLHIWETIQRYAKAQGQTATVATHFPASPAYDPDAPTIAAACGKLARGKGATDAAENLADLLREDGFDPEEWQP